MQPRPKSFKTVVVLYKPVLQVAEHLPDYKSDVHWKLAALHSVFFALPGLDRCCLPLSVVDIALASAKVVIETGTLTRNYLPEMEKTWFCELMTDDAVAGQDNA